VLPGSLKATTIAFVNANSLKRTQSGAQPSNTSGAASSVLIPTRNAFRADSNAQRSLRARATASRSWPA
jgi:hypothetical protein